MTSQEIYQINSDYFLIEKTLTAMSFGLLLNTEKNNQNPAIVKGRLNLCLRNLKKLNTRS